MSLTTLNILPQKSLFLPKDSIWLKSNIWIFKSGKKKTVDIYGSFVTKQLVMRLKVADKADIYYIIFYRLYFVYILQFTFYMG